MHYDTAPYFVFKNILDVIMVVHGQDMLESVIGKNVQRINLFK